MEWVVDLLREKNEAVPVPLTLPDDDELVLIEEELYLSLPNDYRAFLLTVSDVVYGVIEPATATDPQSHTYLPEVAANAWDQGISRALIPVCETGDGYYCIAQDGEVVYWSLEEGLTEQAWTSIWLWARDVWLNEPSRDPAAESGYIDRDYIESDSIESGSIGQESIDSNDIDGN